MTTCLPASSSPLDDDVRLRDELAGKDPYTTATMLLESLTQWRQDEVDDSFEAGIRRSTQSYKLERKRQARKIETLIEELQQRGPSSGGKSGLLGGLFPSKFKQPAAHTYDVTESLLSGFYCTLYWYMPKEPDPATTTKPIWEQVSLRRSNVKGQQYYERNDFKEAVINYSEIWGKGVFLTAEGTFAPTDEPLHQHSKQQLTPLHNALKRVVQRSRSLRSCPDVFQVDATKVTFHVFGMKFDLPIQGSSNLVITYADPRIRIFVSPIESKTAVGNWEEAGLVVAQVRSDLVLGEEVIDLR